MIVKKIRYYKEDRLLKVLDKNMILQQTRRHQSQKCADKEIMTGYIRSVIAYEDENKKEMKEDKTNLEDDNKKSKAKNKSEERKKRKK